MTDGDGDGGAPGWPARVVLATGNPGKAAELQVLLGEIGVDAVVRALPEPEEDAPDYAGNARRKAAAAAAATGLPALGDDVGLEVAAWGGAPGLHTRRWAEGVGGWPQARAALGAAAGSHGTFWCALVLVWPDGAAAHGLGRVHGRIVRASGDGAGLEPGFVPDGEAAALSALDEGVRRRVHHRARAFDALVRDVSARAGAAPR